MKVAEKLTKTEAILLLLTLLFLLGTGAAYFVRQQGIAQADYIVQTELGGGKSDGAELPEADAAPELRQPTARNPLNINSATAEELDLLPEIGETLAGRIVAYRQENGPFAAKEDIMKVDGIGAGTYEKIQDLIKTAEEVG